MRALELRGASRRSERERERERDDGRIQQQIHSREPSLASRLARDPGSPKEYRTESDPLALVNVNG